MSTIESYTTSLGGGKHWSLRVRRGTSLTFTAQDADANVGLVFFNPEHPTERLNLPDTLKAQHTLKLTKGHCLFSDMGRVFASIVRDDVGWHDSIGGTLNQKDMVAKQWQTTSFQVERNNRTQTGLDSFLIELTKWGLSLRDLPANLSLFSKVTTDDAGNMKYVSGNCKKGDKVTLRFEMDTLVAMNTCPHPLDTAEEYPFRTVDVELKASEPPGPGDLCVTSSPEAARAFENNRIYYLGIPEAMKYFANTVLNPEVAHIKSAAKDEAYYANVKPTKLVSSPHLAKNAVFSEIVEAGQHFIREIKKGQTVRIVDVEGNEAADTLFFNARDPSEHYSAIETVRAQQNIYLTTGTDIVSNLGSTMLKITADTCTRHDTLGGACASESNTVRYSLERREMHSCRDNWMLCCARFPEFGITKRDIAHNINFFMNVPATPAGELDFTDGVSGPGKYVELVAKMDTIILISNCPQLNNPCSGYAPTPLEVLVWN